MALTSIHIKPVKGGSEEHNRRTKFLDYVRQDLPHDYWQSHSQADVLAGIKERYRAATTSAKHPNGQSLQKKATPIREGVVVVDESTTMADLHRLAAALQDKFGIRCFQLALHLDEGHYDPSGAWLPNRHAHMVFDWTNAQGKTIKLNAQDMAAMQTMIADVLGMERGKSSDKSHLDALRYKTMAAAKDCEDLEQQRIDKKTALDHENGSAIKTNVAAITGRVADIVGVGKGAATKRRIKELEKHAEGEPQRTERAVKAAVAQIEQNYAQEIGSWRNAARSAQNERDAAQRDLAAMKKDFWRGRLIEAILDYAKYYFHRIAVYAIELADRKPVWMDGKLELTHKDGSPWMSCDMGSQGVALSWAMDKGLLIEGLPAEQFISERGKFITQQRTPYEGRKF